MWEGHGFGGGFMWISWIFTIVVIALVAWGIGALLSRTKNTPEQPTSALEILKQRYARGEINHEEFEEMRKNLLS